MSNFIRQDLREEIQEKADFAMKRPEIYDRRLKLVRDNLTLLGNVHSFWIENPSLRSQVVRKGISEESIMKIAEKGIRQIQDAWYYLLHIGSGHDFISFLTPDVIKSTNSLINGQKAREGQFREATQNSMGGVTLNFQNYTVPSAYKIPTIMGESLRQAISTYYVDPLESSIGLHLALALTQPFFEGNKRTARLIQDRILFDQSLPPAMIPAGEGRFYFDLLERVAPHYRDGNVDGQRPFYNYIASKVNIGLDIVLGDLGASINHKNPSD